MFGLEKKHINNLKNILSDFSQITKAVIYGSRAKGNYKDGSDIDITLFGENLTLKTVYTLEDKFDELYLPYAFDISIFNQIDNPDLIEQINRVGKVLYEKNNLPAGWEMKKLGEVCDFQNGFAFKSQTFKAEGIPIVRIMNIQNERLDLSKVVCIDPKDYDKDLSKYKIVKDDLLIAMSGATTGKIGYNQTNEVLLLNQRVGKFKPKSILNKSYLFSFLSTKVEESLAISAGSAQPNLSTDQIKNFKIPLPSLSEQKRIVSILDRASEAIDKAKANAEQNLKNAKEIFKSYLNNIFDNPGDDWKMKKLGDLGKICMCKRIFKKQTTPKGDIPFFKIGTFGKNPNAFISLEIFNEYKKKYSFPKKGDVLISASGTIGRRVKYDGKPAYFQDSNIVWIDNNDKFVSNEFLYHFYDICNWNPSKGATISRLYNDDLRKIKINFPVITKQKVIVDEIEILLDKTKQLEKIYQKKINALEGLKKSILQKAFSGGL